MAFVALDDCFPQHPKVAALSDAEFRAWIRLLCWSARHRTKGRVDQVGSELPGVNARRLTRFVELGLVDVGDSGLWVHDWSEFNGTKRERELAKERKRAQRAREAGSDA